MAGIWGTADKDLGSQKLGANDSVRPERDSKEGYEKAPPGLIARYSAAGT
jgi:hypothetical protein